MLGAITGDTIGSRFEFMGFFVFRVRNNHLLDKNP